MLAKARLNCVDENYTRGARERNMHRAFGHQCVKTRASGERWRARAEAEDVASAVAGGARRRAYDPHTEGPTTQYTIKPWQKMQGTSDFTRNSHFTRRA